MRKIIFCYIALLCCTVTFSQTAPCFSSPAISLMGGGGQSRGVAAGDMNNDGKQDFIVTNLSNNDITTSLGNGIGFITSGSGYPVGNTPRAVAIADVNNDTYKDALVACSGSNNVWILFGNGSGGYSSSVTMGSGGSPYGIAAGDLNGDGNIDYATANLSGNNVSVRLGNGNGTFGVNSNYSTSGGCYHLAFAKMNADDTLDIVVADNSTNSVSVLIGNGNGTFQTAMNFAASGTPYSLTTGDFNGDGNTDVAVTAYSTNDINILFGSPSGNLMSSTTLTTGMQPFGITCGNYNADNFPDLAVAHNSGSGMRIFSGDGLGGFSLSANYLVSNPQAMITTGDFNNDGFDDLASANFGSGGMYIFLNHRAKIIPFGPTSFCPGGSVQLGPNVGYNFDYSWSPGIHINDTITVNSADTMVLTITNQSSSCSYSDTLVTSLNPLPTVVANASAAAICQGGPLTLWGSGAQTYSWDHGVTDSITFNPTLPFNYTVTGTDSNGCTNTASVNIGFSVAPLQEICTLTVDSATGNHNVIVWEKPPSTAEIDSFYIYRELTLNNYQKIGAVHVDSLSEFHDYGANPNSTGYRYKIKTLDTCGNVSNFGLFHNSIHLAYLSGGNFNWNHYLIEPGNQPALSYNFFRDDISNGNWQLLQVVSGSQTSFTDVNYASYPNARYRVEVGWSTSCTPTRGAINTSRSNIKVTTVGIEDAGTLNAFTISPNPATDEISISVNGNTGKLCIELINELGQLILNSQTQQALMKMDISSLPGGVYFVKIRGDQGVKIKKLVKN